MIFGERPSVGTWMKQRLEERWPEGKIRVVDLTGTDDHFEATVIASEFDGKNTVARHRLVYTTLGDAMKERIHALTIKTLAPSEWKE